MQRPGCLDMDIGLARAVNATIVDKMAVETDKHSPAHGSLRLRRRSRRDYTARTYCWVVEEWASMHSQEMEHIQHLACIARLSETLAGVN